MILIFGAGGQVGQELAARAAAAGMPATALTRGEADICDARQVAEAIAAAKPAVVINAAAYTKECSGGRSDCCTRTCSADATFVASDEDWAKFLDVRGGQIQY